MGAGTALLGMELLSPGLGIDSIEITGCMENCTMCCKILPVPRAVLVSVFVMQWELVVSN